MVSFSGAPSPLSPFSLVFDAVSWHCQPIRQATDAHLIDWFRKLAVKVINKCCHVASDLRCRTTEPEIFCQSIFFHDAMNPACNGPPNYVWGILSAKHRRPNNSSVD